MTSHSNQSCRDRWSNFSDPIELYLFKSKICTPEKLAPRSDTPQNIALEKVADSPTVQEEEEDESDSDGLVEQ